MYKWEISVKETTMTLRIILCCLFLPITGEICRAKEAVATGGSPRIVNIINFIRQCEPRIDWISICSSAITWPC